MPQRAVRLIAFVVVVLSVALAFARPAERVIPGQIQARSYKLYELQRQILTAEKRTLELNTEIKHIVPKLEQLAAKREDPTWLARWVR